MRRGSDPLVKSGADSRARYFINDNDEIRSIENPDCYFKYMINRNDRINYRQRFHFGRKSSKTVTAVAIWWY